MVVTMIAGSTREGRNTPKAVRAIQKTFERVSSIEPHVVDLEAFDLPLLEKRLKNQDEPNPEVAKFAEIVKNSSALIVVSPEYNGGPPGVLKNALDHLNSEYKNLPVGIATVSAGGGGDSCFSFLKELFDRLDARVLERHLKFTDIGEQPENVEPEFDQSFEFEAESFVKEIEKAAA